jgi:hypothetical protein
MMPERTRTVGAAQAMLLSRDESHVFDKTMDHFIMNNHLRDIAKKTRRGGG